MACDLPVSLLDLYPTFNELCGLPVNPNGKTVPPIDGTSLLKLLHNPGATIWEGPSFALTSKGTPDSISYSLRSKMFRYIYTKNGQEELYDHRKDPNEWHNQAGNKQYGEIKRTLKNALFDLISISHE